MKYREITDSETDQLIALFSEIADETDYTRFCPGESQEALIKYVNKSENSSLLVAEDASLIGYCLLEGGIYQRTYHVASLTLGVKQAFWSQGIGKLLVKKVLEKAEAIGIKRIELKVRSDNFRAINLFQSLGFRMECEMSKSLNIDNVFYSEYFMAKVEP